MTTEAKSLRCPHCRRVIYPKTQRTPAPDDGARHPLHWWHTLRYIAEHGPLFPALLAVPPGELPADIAMFLRQGWIEPEPQCVAGFVVTEKGQTVVSFGLPEETGD